jgi:hypothetical protein
MTDHTHLRNVSYTRKPEAWAHVTTTVKREALPADLPTYDSVDLEITYRTLADFAEPVEEQFFLLTVFDKTYLINTEGSNYARYATKVI